MEWDSRYYFLYTEISWCHKTEVRYHLQRVHGVFVKVFRFNQEQRKIIHAFVENESISLLHEQFLEQNNSTYIRELKNGTTTRFHELRGNVLLWTVPVPTIAMYSHISRNTNLKIQTSTIRSVSQSACFGHFTFPSPWWHYKFNLSMALTAHRCLVDYEHLPRLSRNRRN